MFCYKCGAKLPDDSKFCYKCGCSCEIKNKDNSISGTSNNEVFASWKNTKDATINQEKKKKTEIVIAILAVLAVVAAIIICIGIMYSQKKGTKPSSALPDSEKTESSNKEDLEENAELISSIYQEGVKYISGGDTEKAIEVFEGLPKEDHSRELLTNSEFVTKIAELVNGGEWIGKDGYGGEYHSTFSLKSTPNSIVLTNKEKEYFEGDYIYEYEDSLRLNELSGTDMSLKFSCYERDNFVIPLKDIKNNSFSKETDIGIKINYSR